MSISVFTTMLGYMIVCSFTPGPGNILALNTTIQLGWKKGKRLIWGICTGYAGVQVLCTLVVYELNDFFSPMIIILKYIVGMKIQCIYQHYYKIINFVLSLFLLYFAFDIIRGEFDVST
ncbi:hypothetical protein [Pectinatus haikarae]|uniref:Threonine/homoserine/homoserine lactone efflux protein n=1 Tax=Pectinatus haikarae TaxID=349096 RepID=A0ABT9Y4N8_9FIRM|nr:hypothetical protein [Pectinatus haikarae]MDQ0202787.1 threonine/homoserine/homoserine lactone efflux protein [Pectinatus haikarae]